MTPMNVNLEQMRGGFARHFKRYAADAPEVERLQYEAAEGEAREAKRGLWQQQQAILPSVIGGSSRQFFRSLSVSNGASRFRLSRAPLKHDRNGKVGAWAPNGC